VLDGWICQACADDGDDVLGVSTCNDACEKDSDRVVVPCEDYTSRGLPCPDVVNVGAPRTRAGCQSTKCRDIVPLRTLLRAAGISDLDSEGEYHDGTLGRQSWRFSGLILHVDIFYTNHGVTNTAGLFSSSAYNPKEYECECSSPLCVFFRSIKKSCCTLQTTTSSRRSRTRLLQGRK